MNQNYIFLDIDGVLFPTHHRKGSHINAIHLKKQLEIKHNISLDDVSLSDIIYVTQGWNQEAILNLQKVVAIKNAKIIISSSWKFTHSFEVLKKLFTLIDLGEVIIDSIPNRYGIIKHETIHRYLKKHPEITSYIVLDDIPMESYFPNHFVYCPDVFNQEAYEKSISLLK